MSILNFHIPNGVFMQKVDNFQGTFEFEPLEKGYGITIGNALRRVLLSSLGGYAIIGARFQGISHEFSTIKGIKQDVTEIILSLKQVRLKKIIEDPELKITLDIKNQEEFRAKDIMRFTNNFEILNPEFLIFQMDSSVHFHADLILKQGRGFLLAEENTSLDDESIGFIAMDAVFTPIKNVKYRVENTRVKQRTDFEKLILDIKTDGSLHPEEALKEAASILIQHFRLFSDQGIVFEQKKEEDQQKKIDEEFLRLKKLMKIPIRDLELSVRAFNCLKGNNVKCLGNLISLKIDDIMKFRNFGKKSLAELEKLVSEKKLFFGMDISKYKLEED